MIHFTQEFKNVVGCAGVGTDSLTTGVCDLVSLKNVHKAWIEIVVDHAGSGATVWQPEMATSVNGTPTAITDTVNIWKNGNIASTDTLVKQTMATSITMTADAYDYHVIFEIDPATLIANSATGAINYDCLGIYVSSGGSSSDKATVIYHLEMRYQQEQPPSAIVD